MGRQEDNVFLYVSSSGNAFKNYFFYKVFSSSAVYSLQVFLLNTGRRPTKTTCDSANDNAYFPHWGKQVSRAVKNVFRFASVGSCSVGVNLDCSVFILSSFRSILLFIWNGISPEKRLLCHSVEHSCYSDHIRTTLWKWLCLPLWQS